jgi:hypothetical protein
MPFREANGMVKRVQDHSGIGQKNVLLNRFNSSLPYLNGSCLEIPVVTGNAD